MQRSKSSIRKAPRAARRQDVHVVLPENLTNAVRELAAARRVPVRAIYEAAVSAYVSPGAQDQRDAMLACQLNRFSRAVESADWSTKLLVAMQRYQIELDLSFLPEPITDEERKMVTEKRGSSIRSIRAMANETSHRSRETLRPAPRTSHADRRRL